MIKVLSATPNPIQFIGKVSGICYESDTETPEKNYKRGLDCIKKNHGRVMEYVDVVLEISNYSARAGRELYTHVVGTSRIQASTRYIDYKNFDYYTPTSIQSDSLSSYQYDRFMNEVENTYKTLLDNGIPKEDIANILPLGMTSKIVLKINYRALLHFAEMRLCSRAYEEIQDLTKEIIEVVSVIDEEWKVLASKMMPKCKTCTETENCKNKKGE